MNERPSVPIKLVDGKTKELVDAVLFEGISEGNASSHSQIWVPILQDANDDAEAQGKQPVAEDVHWRWENKLDFRSGQLAYRGYAIECKGVTEGMMMTNLVGHQSKIEPPKDVLYVEYLSVAPKNREIIQNPPKHKAVGRILFAVAVQLSREEGLQGRVGLHSLPGAASWYLDKLGLVSFGPDSHYKGLEYFELKAEDAVKMLEAMKQE